MDGEVWWAAVHGVAKSRTRLSDFPFTFHFHTLEKEMATHSNVLAWRIPGTGDPGGLPSLGSNRVGHHWSDLAAAAADLIDQRSKKVSAVRSPKAKFGVWVSVCHACLSCFSRVLLSVTPWIVARQAWQPTPVSLPGASHGQRSLVVVV